MQSFKQFGDSLAVLRQLFYQNPALSDVELNAMVGLAYIYGQISIIQANPSYVPQNEFDMLNHMMGSLPQDHVLQKRIKPLLSLVESQLGKRDVGNVTTTPLQDAKQVVLNAQDVMKALQQHLDGLLEDKDYRRRQDKSEVAKKHDQILEQIRKVLAQTPATQSVVSEMPNKDSKQPDSKTADVNAGEPLRSLFFSYRQGIIPTVILSQVIECLLSNSSDKKDVVQKCLKTYQTVYDRCPRESDGANVLLKGMPTLFGLFNKYLQPGEIQQLIAATSFYLADKQASENDEAYSFYCLAKAVMFGEEAVMFGEELQGRNTLNPYESESFLEFMSGPGKTAAEPSKSLQRKELLYLPPTMQFRLQQLDEKTAADFLGFLNKYQEINKRAELFHQRPIALFLAKLDDKIIQLIDIMGRNGIAYMNKQLAATALTLERMLENLPLIDKSLIAPMQAYYSKQMQPGKRDSNVDDAFYNCLIAASILTQLYESLDYKAENSADQKPPLADYIMAMAVNRSPSEFLQAMVSVIIKKILPDMSIDISEQQISEMFKRVSPERFAKLALASQKMQQDEYREVFLHLLKLDLTGGDIDGFLHKATQENQVGKDLSEHNAKIRKKLEEHKVLPKDALSYSKTYDFVVTSTPEGVNSIHNMRLVIWNYLQQLDGQTAVLQSGKITNQLHLNRLLAIQKCLSKIKASIKEEKQSQAIAAKLATPVNESLINKIIKNAEAFNSDRDKAPLPTSFTEFANHVRDQFQLINSNKGKEEKAEKKKDKGQKEQYYFTVEQWPKERAQTFFLGDEVGCCLATNGAQFQAMVQRRMDDAMLFHVAVDKDTGKPAALAWLYLAETKDDKIVLMANFFEVNTKYGNNPALRIPLLNGILKFTEQYLKDNPAIDGFYMNQLTHGWNIADISSYPVKPLTIADKLGGPFVTGYLRYSLGGEDEESKKEACAMTKDKYYLVSLSQSQFHQFDPAVLAKEVTDNVFPLQDLIQDSMLAMVQRGLEFETILGEISQRHHIELEHFYSTPIEKCEAFTADMRKWHLEAATAVKAALPKGDKVLKKSMFDKPATPKLLTPEGKPVVKKYS